MKKVIKIVNICVLCLCLFHIVLYGQFLDLFVDRIAFNLAGIKYLLHLVPYLLLIITFIVNIIYLVFCIIKKKKKYFIISSIFVIILFVSTLIFTTPFQFVHSKECIDQYELDEEEEESDDEDEEEESSQYDFCYRSDRYDKLFVTGGYESTEGGYSGDFGEYRYIYIPIAKKLIIIGKKTGIYDVKYIDDEEIKIGDRVYLIRDVWFDES